MIQPTSDARPLRFSDCPACGGPLVAGREWQLPQTAWLLVLCGKCIEMLDDAATVERSARLEVENYLRSRMAAAELQELSNDGD